MLQVVRLLRLCRDHGLSPAWNIILGTPGETDDDYREMIELLPSLKHLEPPRVCTVLSLVRFSPLFESMSRQAASAVRPSLAYRLTYGLPEGLLRDVASAFDFDDAVPKGRARAYRYRLRAEVRSWQEKGGGDCDLVRSDHGTVKLVDTRGRPPIARELDGLESFVLLETHRPRTQSQLEAVMPAAVRQVFGDGLEECLGRLVSQKLLARSGVRFLSLASLGDGGSATARTQAPVSARGRA